MQALCCYVWALSSCSEQGLLSSYGAGFSCSGCSCCGGQALVSTRPSSRSARLSCPTARGIFLNQALDSRLLHWQADS